MELVLVLIALVIAAIILYLSWQPVVEPSRRRSLRIFNTAVVVILLLSYFGISLWIRAAMAESADRYIWPVAVGFWCLLSTAATLFVAMLFRNLVLFKR